MIKKILAIAHGTLTEFIRNRIFMFLIIFGLAIGVTSSLLPAISPEDKTKLIFRAAFSMTGLFSALLIIYFIATSIHRDIEEKTIYMVFSRPASRFMYISGKAIGFFSIAFIMVFALSGVTLGYLMVVYGRDMQDSRIYKPVKYIKGHGPIITGEIANLELASAGVGLIGDGSSAIWIFRGLHRIPFKEDKVQISLKMGGINVNSNAGTAFVGVDILDKDDKQLQPTQYAYVGSWNPDTCVAVDRSIVVQNKELKVKVFPSGKNFYIAPMKNDTAFLLRDHCSFFGNYFRASGFLFFLVSLLSVITLSSSAFFGQKMALTLSFFAYITGHTLPYLKSFGSLIGMKSIAEMQSFMPGHGHLHQAETYSKLPAYLIEGLHITVIKKFIIGFSSIFPDFKRFDPAEYFLHGAYIDNIILLQTVAYMLFYGSIFLAFAWLCFWKRELVSR
ncbi:MAG: ABC transporter permease [Candidatus Brocadia sp.]|jgi:ABC-type transport system involved in multi-copper enzyme maturation permease subunit